ncbi:hypothetical protein BJ138DRAFT_28732 [Hygrophoropsis aurantiaca]|uniref:Uncharacterized protein n=1 Tax=Hygrophoropsis aurantiaca TaxID=72124 RepID=A0ACB8ADD4_9AGAM|nr:hypothetical protein BJ138DRAFT_28732 [Hygrophoropsis aurantiaca]
MNFSFATDSPFNTVLMSPEGRIAYRIDTPSYLPVAITTVKKAVSSSSPQGDVEVGRVIWQTGRAALIIHGREVTIHRSIFGSSRTFTAANEQSYKWSFHEGSSLLASNDSRQAPAATFTPSNKLNPGLLHLTPHGLTFLDETILTFVYVEGERRNAQRKKSLGG